MIPAPLNLYFKQGADFVLSVTLLQGETIRPTFDVQAGATEIPVDPMTQAIAADRKLLFDVQYAQSKATVMVTLTADVALGATTIPVEAIALPIPKKSKGWVCADLAGCTAHAEFKGKLSKETTPNQFTVEFDSDRLTGHLDVKLLAEQTLLVPANLALGTVLTDDELQSRTRQPNDYDWDLQIVYDDDRVECPHQGVIVVYPNV